MCAGVIQNEMGEQTLVGRARNRSCQRHRLSGFRRHRILDQRARLVIDDRPAAQ
jgi:hypothetical protein